MSYTVTSDDSTNLKQALALLKDSQVDDVSPADAIRKHNKSPADKERVYSIAARFMFAGEPDRALAEALGKTTRTIERLRKDEGYITFYQAYCEQMLSDTDKKLKAKVAAIAPAVMDRMIDLTKQDQSLHVKFLSARWLLEKSSSSDRSQIQLSALQLPQELRHVLKQAGEAAKRIPKTLKDAKRRSTERTTDGSEGSGT